MASGTINQILASQIKNDVPFLQITDTTAITSGDLNNYNTNGILRIGGTLPAHAPSGSTWTVLWVLIVGTTKIQIIISATIVWIRTGNSSEWFSWYKFEGVQLT